MLHPVRSGMTCASPNTKLNSLPTSNLDILPTMGHLHWDLKCIQQRASKRNSSWVPRDHVPTVRTSNGRTFHVPQTG